MPSPVDQVAGRFTGILQTGHAGRGHRGDPTLANAAEVDRDAARRKNDQFQIAAFIKRVRPPGVRIDTGARQRAQEGDQIALLGLGQIELGALRPRAAAETVVEPGVLHGNAVVMVHDIQQRCKAGVVHEGPIGRAGRINQIPEAGRTRHCQVRPARKGTDDAVVAAVRIDIKFRRPMATRATGPAIPGSRLKQLFSAILLRRKTGEVHVVPLRLRPPLIVSGIKRLDAAHELGDRALDARLIDRGIAIDNGEKGLVFPDDRKLGDQLRESGIAFRPAEPHLNVVLDGPGGLVLQAHGPLVPEEPSLLAKARVDQTHRMPAGRPRHPDARRRHIAERMLLLVTGRAGNRVVAGKALVVEQHPPQRRAEIGDRIPRRRVVPLDIGGNRLARVVGQPGEIEDSILRHGRKGRRRRRE